MSSFLTRKHRKKYGLLRNVSRPDSTSYSAFGRTLDPQDDIGGTVYLFGDHDDDEYELYQVRDRGSPNDSRIPTAVNSHASTYIEKDIENGDSLANLALRYGCSVADLKRANKLISDQEFHALRKIKVPVKPYSLLTECSNDGKPSTSQQSDKSLNSEDEDTQPVVQVRTLAIGDSLLSGPSEAFLRHMDEDLERIRRATCQYKSSLQEVAAELTCKRFHPFHEQTTTGSSHLIPLRTLLAVGALITLIVPVVIIILELQKDKHS